MARPQSVHQTYERLARVGAALDALDDLHPGETRLLSPTQERAARRLAAALGKARLRLLKETEPTAFRPGDRVTIRGTFEATRTPSPRPGTRGMVEGVRQDAFGWWVAVRVRRPFTDVDGGRWSGNGFPSDDPIILFKSDELDPTPARPLTPRKPAR